MTICSLESQKCNPCQGETDALPEQRVMDLLDQVPGWQLVNNASMLRRVLSFKGFAKAVYTANLAAFVSDQTGHHADIRFGWGYCEIDFTTHELGGLSNNDFVCAARINKLLDG